MLDSVESGDVFYDSVDCLSLSDEEFGSGFWRNELRSVKERREEFLCKMGFVGVGHFSDSYRAESVAVELDRVSESSGAVSSSCNLSASGNVTVENSSNRYCNGEANAMVDEPETDLSCGLRMDFVVDHKMDDRGKFGLDKKGAQHWWKKMASKKVISTLLSMAGKGKYKAPGISRTKVQANKKRFKELSALYTGQEFRAHKGVIWTAKFSPNGQYLATGGQDGVVRVWCVTSADAHEMRFADQGDYNYGIHGDKTGLRKQKTFHAPVMIPDRVFQIKESPIHEFHGHGGDILDLAWSNSNQILSSSTDNNVRLWQVGSDECLSVFRHTDFVTCVQFNPIKDGYFVSGSLDGKIRIWSMSEGRVIDWDNVRDAVTAISYQPDGQGLVAGFLNGMCRFYEASGSSIHLSTQIQISGSKRSSGSRIAWIQFCQENPQRVIVTSEDSKIRVFEKTGVVKKYRGLPKSGAQMSASFTPNGRHILSVGEDSRVYLWEYSNQHKTPSKQTKSTRSCEYFHSQGVSVALPWHGYESAQTVPACSSRGCAKLCCAQAQAQQDSERISLAKWFSTEGSSRVTATWPEEMLPSPDLHHEQEQERMEKCGCEGPKSPMWGLVIVTASCDGMIRVFHNYGLLPLTL